MKKIIAILFLTLIGLASSIEARPLPPAPYGYGYGYTLHVSQSFVYKGRPVIQLSDGSYWRVPRVGRYNPVESWHWSNRIHLTPSSHWQYNVRLNNIDCRCSARAERIEIYSWMDRVDWKDGTPRYFHPAVYSNPHCGGNRPCIKGTPRPELVAPVVEAPEQEDDGDTCSL